MSKLLAWVVVAVIGLAVLTTAGPLLLRMLHGAVPLVLVVGIVLVVLRLVWYFTNRY